MTTHATGALVVVVEGFFDCIKVWQANYPCAALMGSATSAEKGKLLAQKFTDAVLMFDGDETGMTGAGGCAPWVSEHIWVRTVRLPSDVQPDQLKTEEIKALVEGVL